MYYVKREDGVITGIFRQPQDGLEEEFLEESDPEIVAFFESKSRRPVVEEISDRQFFHALALNGLITGQEALAAVKTGDLPQAFEVLLGTLPEEEQFSARIILEGATIFKRSHPLTNMFGGLYGMSSSALDALWEQAAGL